PSDAKARFLSPSSLKSPQQINNKISTHISDAILWALEMHPDERPSTIHAFREVFSGHRPRPQNGRSVRLMSTVGNAIQQNRLAILLAFFLFVVAILITIL
ncbi:MAG: hypothetical protein GY943_19455, partial [Chloroflexi bacterium]|nr:hypothetical protein [Chloroflexota bacterium]